MAKPTLLLAALMLFTGTLSAQGTKGAHPVNQSTNQPINQTRAVVVGISDYQDAQIPDLRFADRDAEAFANWLRSPAGGSLDGDHLKVLTNQQATMGKIAAALDWLLDVCGEGDQAIIYFSGHGDVERKTISQPGYLLCWDAPPQVYMSGGAFNLRDLEEVVGTLSVQNKARVIVVADACHAGKLSGSGIGGAQITGASLARQYANEVKILSCQPNEYSLEGEQWGGGRGLFSYHLLDGLLGLADRNTDAGVTLSELERYLEDHVTPEAAPHSQNPVILGSKTAQLAVVVPEILSELKKGKSGQLAVFSKIDSRGLEDDVLAGADTSIRELYRLFKKTLDDKAFFEPANACADIFYEKLIAEPKLARLHHTMRRNYAAALQDDAQQAVNNLMKTEKTEVRLYRLERVKKYAPYPRYLARAAELLGQDHYLYATLQGRRCYFEGILLQMESPLNPDSLLGRRLLDKYRESLAWQPDAALTYMAMGEVFSRQIPSPDSLVWFIQKAIEVAPNLFDAYVRLAYHFTGRRMKDQARQYLDQAMALDSSHAGVWVAYGFWHYVRGDKDAAEPCFKIAANLDSAYSKSHYWLGILAFDRNDMPGARQNFLEAAKAYKPDPSTFDYLGSIHYNKKEYEEAEKYYLQGLAIEPFEPLLLVHYASICWKTNRPEQAKSLLEKAMAYDSTSAQTLFNVGEIYFDNGFYPEAENALLKSLALDSTNGYIWVLLGQLYRSMQRTEAALAAVERGIRIDSTLVLWGAAWGTLTDLYMQVGRNADAEILLKKALFIDSSNVNIRLRLGLLYERTGRETEARQLYDSMLKRDSTFQAHYALGLHFLKNRRYEEAQSVYQKILLRDPGNKSANYNLACMRGLQNRADEAFEFLEKALKNGWKDYNWMQQDTDLASLREQTERWKALMKKYFPDQVKD